MNRSVQPRPRWPIAVILVALVVVIALGAAEFALRALGIGDPILYDSNPIYGYRPIPNRAYRRLGRGTVTFNNLGIRTTTHWDSSPERKVLFLGDSVTFGGDIVGDADVFATLAVKSFPGWSGGDAGVNAWGVENIHALITEMHFLPAKVYVTVLPEGDFVRGLTRIQGLPFYNVKPRTALQEVLYKIAYTENNKRYRNWETINDAGMRRMVINKAARELHELDVFLKARSLRHLIFISPSRAQVLSGEPKDEMVVAALRSNGIEAIYILDRIAARHLSADEQRALFFDHIHLRASGHRLWASIIAEELRQQLQ